MPRVLWELLRFDWILSDFFQEIDGRSLLLLHRQDVLGGLGLKMGPALKIFSQIKRLQTKREFPN